VSTIFDACRAITAYEAAQQAGMLLKRSGSRWWTCCPFHREKTPSLCFFPDGGFKCFGCGVCSDAVRVYRDAPEPFEYSGLYPVRKVNNWGYLRFEPARVYLSETMADTYLEIRPGEQGDSFRICYRHFAIAEIDAASCKLINRKISRL
jgi:hypothetical protein